MWANVLQFVSDDGLPMKELPSRCGIAKATVKSMVSCLKRHGWVAVDAGGVIRLTARGLEAKRAFPRAKEAVERQWVARWGRQTVDALRSALDDDCTVGGLVEAERYVVVVGQRDAGDVARAHSAVEGDRRAAAGVRDEHRRREARGEDERDREALPTAHAGTGSGAR
jgi:DNA-binding IclR family transcriptional regulator